MSIENLYIDYNIEMAPDGHKHNREGWVNTSCPHCSGSSGYHLGFNEGGNYYYCWKCGGHGVDYTIGKLLGISINRANDLIKEYRLSDKRMSQSGDSIIKIGKRVFKYPSGLQALKTPHKKYLWNRGFNPNYLEKVWGVQATSMTSSLDSISYKFRILVPIYWGGEIVSFQCRDYTGKQKKKYMVCPTERERIHHKDIVYGLSQYWGSRRGLIVEGVFDAWRFQGRACALFGIGYTRNQVRQIKNLFDEVFIMFDPEPQAQQKAEQLRKDLVFKGVRAYRYEGIKTDPGELSNGEALDIIKELELDSGSTFVVG